MRSALAAVSFLLGGCVPFAIPPGYFEIGAAARRNQGPDTTFVDGPMQIRAAVAPLGLLHERPQPVDIAAGAFFDLAKSDPIRGGYMELGAFPWSAPIGDGTLVRIEPRLQGRILYDPDSSSFGSGVAGGLSFDFLTFADGSFSSTGGTGGAFGYMFGESGVGVYVEAGYEQLHDRRFVTFSGGLQIHIPLMLGFAYGIPH